MGSISEMFKEHKDFLSERKADVVLFMNIKNFLSQ